MRVVLIAAQSLDGFITRHDVPGTAFTSEADRAWFPACLEYFDVGVLGGESYRESRATLREQLKFSRCRRVVLTREPERYAADVIPGKLEFTAEPVPALLERLRTSGVRDCAILGGNQINALFLAADAVDELWLTIEPRVFGSGRPLAGGKLEGSWYLRSVERLGPDSLLVRYQRRPPARRSPGVATLQFAGTVLGVTVALAAAGAVLGAVIFPLVGALNGSSKSLPDLALWGAKDVGFYVFIWAPGIGITYAVIREWRRAAGKDRGTKER